MSESPDVARARQMLEEQIAALGSLRNGTTRDNTFKQWRQNTLTVIQRCWPGEPQRGERFRRVPFSAPSSRADAREMREYFERGCAEALSYLRSLLAEIDKAGLPRASAESRPASLDPGVAEDDFPTVDLPGGPAHAPAAPAATGGAGAPRFEMPALPKAEPPAPAEPAKPRAAKAATPVGKAQVRTGKSGRKNGGKARLKDMLGFDDESAAAHAAEPAPAAEETPVARPPAIVTPITAARPHDPPPAEETGHLETLSMREDLWPAGQEPPLESEPAEEPRQEEPREPAEEEPREISHAEQVAEVLSAEIDVERAMEDFLRLSPVLASKARPVRRPISADAGPFTAPAALALAALASDIEALDVPEGHRARARATLLDLARHMDSHDVSWDALREGVNFAMEFPAIGRRVLPLLVPYLDQAA